MTLAYVLRRIGFFFLVVWFTATLNFAVIHLAPGDPTAAQIGRLQLAGANVQNGAEIIAHYRQQFGLDEPLLTQYWKYLLALAHLNLGYSIAHFPNTVSASIVAAAPWTIGLVLTSLLIAWTIGSILGALLVWRGVPRLFKGFLTPLMMLWAIPPYLLALLLIDIFAFRLHLFPSQGGQSAGSTNALTFSNTLDILEHALLPGLALVLSSLGGWMFGMRAMMVSVIGEDYLMLAEAKGLRRRRIFLRYAMRNAILPQITALAIQIGLVVSGVVLVEIVFSYPGLGYLLVQAVANTDYPLIEGITLILVISVAGAILLLDLLYPLIDPRINYRRA
jgi:peptide/nickel transport system permease protein